MAAINIANYRNITGFYSEAQTQVVGLADYYYDAAVEILLINDFEPELDLLEPFYNAYISAQSAYVTPPVAVVNAVGSLQRHVLNRARTAAGAAFTNINSWIDAGASNGYLSAAVGRQDDLDQDSFQVETEFASLSGQAGFTIDAANIV